ncbi:MAG: hypothetical protein QM775_26670 [Pirellulales bacterium]
MIIVAVIQTIVGPLMVLSGAIPVARGTEGFVYGILFGIAGAFWALALWSRKSPLPASIVGLVLYVSLHVLDAVVDPTTIAKGFIMKIFIIVLLVQAIQAGLKYRQFAASQNGVR